MSKDQPPGRADLEALDAADPLAPFRAQFLLPASTIYLDGNSLGALPRATAGRIARLIEQEWGEDLIRSWNKHGWIDLPLRLGDKIGRLVGAAPGQVAVTDSTSVNLFKLLAAALRLRPGRNVILSEAGNFPTDLYMAEGLASSLARGHRLECVAKSEIADMIGAETAVVMLTHVDFKSGEIHDMTAITRRAQEAGALMLWDLCHSAGALPVALDECGVDLAVCCGYKYLNGGPGAPAFLYVAQRLQEAASQPLTGWFGHEAPFAFEAGYRAAPGIRRMLAGTPPILSMAALECGVDLLLAADLTALRAKSVAMGDLFIRLMEERCAGQGFALASPREAVRRGSQVAFRHVEGYPIMQALIARGVIGDFRAPDLMRFGFAPLYLGYADLWDAVEALRQVMAERAWERPEFRARAAVT
jgi:kynureninase